jgi:ATP-dependent DNA helicase RecG
LSDLGKKSFARNPLLVDLVHRLWLVEKVGSGISRVRELMKDKILFDVDSDWFTWFIPLKSK